MPTAEENNSCQNCSTDFIEIRKDAFAFCRYGVMLILWLAFFLHLKLLVLLTFAILFFSALLTIKHAPMIVLYNYTIGLFVKSKKINAGVDGMRFAHALGSFFALIAVVFLYFINIKIGWIIVFFLAIMKTISALGLCPAYKLYNCLKAGGCCSISKKLKK